MGLETFVFSCGCEHVGAYIRSEQELSEDETSDGSYIVRLQVCDLEGTPLLDWTEKREPAKYL